MSALRTETLKQLRLLTRRPPPDTALILACRDYGLITESPAFRDAATEARHLRVIAAQASRSPEGLYEKGLISLDLLDRHADKLSALCLYLLRTAIKSALEIDTETSIEAWKQIEADARCASTALSMETAVPSLYRDVVTSTLRNIIPLAREKAGRAGAREFQT